MSAHRDEPRVLRMINPLQHYAWGSTTAFVERFGWPADGRPRAELWMGSHPKAPSSVVLPGHPAEDSEQGTAGHDQALPLDRLLAQRPDLLGEPADLGAQAAELPFLLKVLAAAQPLSIQTHPTAARAADGFAAEEAAGIPLDAPHRMYRDAHHKPELIVALEDFTALCGFRPAEESAAELRVLAVLLRGAGRPTDSACLAQLAETLSPAAGDAEPDREPDTEPDQDTGTALQNALAEILDHRREDYAAAAQGLGALFAADPRRAPAGLSLATVDTLRLTTEAFPGDPGVVVTLLLNRLDLSPGEALFLPAGNLHAYLRGVGVEVMASSDNVLRGGLTAKHIDIDELLTVTECAVLPIPVCQPVSLDAGSIRRVSYRPDCTEFQLDRFDAPERLTDSVTDSPTDRLTTVEPTEIETHRAAVLLCTAGTVGITEHRASESEEHSGETFTLCAGESALLTAGARATLHWRPGTQVFLAQPGRSGSHRRV